MRADWAAEFVQFLLQFENSEPSIDDEEALVCLTVLVEAVAEPVESIAHFTVPRCLVLPVDFLDVAKMIESEVHAH